MYVKIQKLTEENRLLIEENRLLIEKNRLLTEENRLLIEKKQKPVFGNTYTYNDMYTYCGGNSIMHKGIITGDKPGIVISDKSWHPNQFVGNMIYYAGTTPKRGTPETPRHQSPVYFPNKYLDDTRDSINVFFKIAPDQYVHIGMGKRCGNKKIIQIEGQVTYLYPIVYMTGILEKQLFNLRNGYGYISD
jgi:hypothetical protein